MSFCQCILGRNGKCCRDQQQGKEWVDNKITFPYGPMGPSVPPNSGWGITCTPTGRRIVRKGMFGRWVVTNHPGGPRYFDTWREAMNYAQASCMMWNLPDFTWT